MNFGRSYLLLESLGRMALASPSSYSVKDYAVNGIYRRASTLNTGRIDHILRDPYKSGPGHHGDLADATWLRRILEQVNPDEVYNVGAQSHVRVSYDEPDTPPTSSRSALYGFSSPCGTTPSGPASR